jgi:lipopolysaccharide biosynthesis glycosyltransferase
MKGYDRVIYLDSDMLVIKDISELATDENLNNRPIWFTLNSEDEDKKDSNIFYNPDLHKRIVSYRRTVSTGIMVINMDQISKFTRQGLIYLAEVGRTYDGTDQGVVNQWLEEKELNFGILGKEYNHLATNKIEDDTKIIHYFGRKPWESGERQLTIIPDTSVFRVENDELWEKYKKPRCAASLK